jgi:hypothetical protein
VLRGKHSKVGLGELERAVLEHAQLVQHGAALVREGLCVPGAIRLNAQQVEDALQTALQEVDGFLVVYVFLLHLLSLLLGALDIVHDFFEELSTALEVALRGIADAVVLVPLDLVLQVLDLLSQLF